MMEPNEINVTGSTAGVVLLQLVGLRAELTPELARDLASKLIMAAEVAGPSTGSGFAEVMASMIETCAGKTGIRIRKSDQLEGPREFASRVAPCGGCGGTGERVNYAHIFDDSEPEHEPCDACRGTGTRVPIEEVEFRDALMQEIGAFKKHVDRVTQ